MIRRIFSLLLIVLMFGACATAAQPTAQDANVGEGDKYIVGNIAGLAAAKGHPRWSDKSDSNNRDSKTTSFLTYIDAAGVVHPVVGPDGKPLQLESTGYSTLVLNYGTVTQTVTGSGTTDGANTQGSTPTATPTNTPEVVVDPSSLGGP